MKFRNISIMLFLGLYAHNGMSLNQMNEKKGHTMINIGILDKSREQGASLLNKLLANEYVLFTKTFKYHWNVEGMSFGPLHSLFQEQYEALFKIIDDTAERVRALGYKADGTLQEFSTNATLKEGPGSNPSAQGMIQDLLTDHETIIQQIRDDIDVTVEINDMGTNNFLSDLIEKHEKIAWMLRAHLAG